jgi:DNA-directed RNA polymerase specialized sigma24 family protein
LEHRQIQRAAFLYARLGLSLAAIADLEGVYPNAVRHRLRAAGIALRPRGRRTGQKRGLAT